MEGGSTINSHSGGGSLGTSSSGIKGTGAVDFRTVYKNRTLRKQAGMHTTTQHNGNNRDKWKG